MSYLHKKGELSLVYDIPASQKSKHEKEILNIYQDCVNKAAKLLDSKTAFIFSLSKDKKNIEIKAFAGTGKKKLYDKSLLLKSSDLKYILKLKEPVIINSVTEEIKGSDIFRPPFMISPIIIESSPRGFLVVCNKTTGKIYNKRYLPIAGLIVSSLVDRLHNFYYLYEKNEFLRKIGEIRTRYLNLYENINASFFWVDSDGEIVDVNQAMVKLLGYSKQELLKLKIEDITREALFGYKKIMNNKKSCDEVKLIRKDGKLIDVEISYNKIKLGSDTFHVGIVKEIGEKKRLERQVKESRYKFLTIIDGIKDGILLVNKNLKVLAMNKEQAKRSKLTVSDAIGKDCYEVIHYVTKMTCETTDCSIKKAIITKKVSKRLHITKNEKGEKEFIEITSFPLFNPNGEIDQVVSVLRDVTHERRLHRQLIYSEKLATLGTLSAKIGHEIRNPLTAILACAQYLGMKDVDNQNLKIIISEASRIQGMVNDLLMISAPKPPTETIVFLEKVLEEALHFLKNITGQIKYHKIIKEFSDIPPIRGDEEKLKQLFTNIILNASQAMEKAGKREGDLIIGTKLLDDKEYSITYITDCGEGIPKEDLKKIFDPFYTTKGAKGTGLGMVVAKEIVDSHNGKIEIKSKVRVGTTVSVCLPVAEKSL
jgi:PAS domain S-box-containing protein